LATAPSLAEIRELDRSGQEVLRGLGGNNAPNGSCRLRKCRGLASSVGLPRPVAESSQSD